MQTEFDRVSQELTGGIKQLAERYTTSLPKLLEEIEALSAKVDKHLKKIGFGYARNWQPLECQTAIHIW